jgi:hypothetical protein
VKKALALVSSFALTILPAAALAATPLAEIVTGTVDEHELRLHVRSTLREPVLAAKAAPMMAPFFAKTELEDALQKYGPYLLEHVHVQARAKVLPGKVVSAQLMDAIDAPVNQATDLEKHFADVELAWTTETQDPLTLSFDILADREVAPACPSPSSRRSTSAGGRSGTPSSRRARRTRSTSSSRARRRFSTSASTAVRAAAAARGTWASPAWRSSSRSRSRATRS